jgi:hypothetical protein
MKLTGTNTTTVSLFAFSFFVFLLCIPVSAGGTQSRTYSDDSPIDYRVVVPCSNDAIVRLSGTLHTTFGSHQDANDGYHVTSHSNWQGVTAINEETGEVYRFISNGNTSFTSSASLPFTSNTVSHGAVVSAGNGIIFYLHNIYHVTMNAQGEISAQFLYQTVDCKNEVE